MSLFRSRPMKHYNLVVPRESAWSVMDRLGYLDQLHFVDYDATIPMINRPFANYVKRCDDSLYKITQVETFITKFNKKVVRCTNVPLLLEQFTRNLQSRDKAPHTFFDEIEQDIDQKRISLMDLINNFENLEEKLQNYNEQLQVLKSCQRFIFQGFRESSDQIDDRSQPGRMKLNNIIGVIDKDDEIRFRRLIFRVTKGNIWLDIFDLDPQDELQKRLDKVKSIYNYFLQKNVLRAIFVIVYPGIEEQSLIKLKLSRIVDSFSKTKFDLPKATGEYEKKIKDIQDVINETTHLIVLSRQQIESQIESLIIKSQTDCSLIEELRLYVVREKYLYQNLNFLRMQGSIFSGHFWLPDGEFDNVEQALRNLNSKQDFIPTGQITEVVLPKHMKPPTYFKLNIFTGVFQEIVNTYGIPRYQEVNPALFAIITFPFIFGVMFADIAHGFLMFLCGMYVIIFHKTEAPDSLFKLLAPGRYLIALMGFFAFYNGFIYNDFLSIPLNLFGSCYDLVEKEIEGKKEEIWEGPREGCVYPFGLDPVWLASSTALTFINSYKMKLSVIIGVVHMLVGIVMKGVNSLFFKNYIDFFCEFIPQFLFMICAFGWMDFMIIFKWLTSFTPQDAPGLIPTMIDQTLSPLSEPKAPLFEDPLQQRNWSFMLLCIAFVCVPWMLWPKVFLLSKKSRPYDKVDDIDEEKLQQDQHKLFGKSEIDLDENQEINRLLIKHHSGHSVQSSAHNHDEHDFSELFVHQIIETIEFVLGGISNTASYLRLWALSLAHGQLAEVFYNMFLAGNIGQGGIMAGFVTAIFYYTFAMMTFGVLMVMDSMECFLHALRLHWVEFQNKFFKADGYLFVNFSYQKALTDNGQHDQ